MIIAAVHVGVNSWAFSKPGALSEIFKLSGVNIGKVLGRGKWKRKTF